MQNGNAVSLYNKGPMQSSGDDLLDNLATKKSSVVAASGIWRVEDQGLLWRINCILLYLWGD
jgi:hypothetical protein